MIPSALQSVAEASVEDRLAVAIEAAAAESPERTAIVLRAGAPEACRISYGSLASRLKAFEFELVDARPIGVVARAKSTDALVIIAAACGRQQIPVALLSDDSRDLVGQLSDWVVADDELQLRPSADEAVEGPRMSAPHVVVATSGTSGPPRLIEHSWDTVVASARLAEQWHGLAWLLSYDSTRWAGIQVWLLALLTGGCLVVPSSRDPYTVARGMAAENVAVLPATPTLLRRLLVSGDSELLRAVPLTRITLGGEAADGRLLERAHAVFPNAKLTQVYATTELGEVFRVADGLPGFPASWINRALPGGVRLSMRRDGELLVQLSRDTAEVGTGDLVERRGDRFEFTGRRSDVIVVGGAKVYPKRVEEVLRGVAGVAEARAYGQPSAITGEIVAAEVVLTDTLPPGTTPESIRASALATCRHSLEPHGVPRILDLVKRITTTAAGKTSRRPSAAAERA
jgi:acyl-CoA synthetase (AMP-forming)/AMP-acid ligase II